MDSIALRAELGLLQSDGNPCCSADKMDTTLPKSSNSSCALFEESSFLSLSASEAQLQLQEEEVCRSFFIFILFLKNVKVFKNFFR